MDLCIREEPIARLAEHSRVPIAFVVDRILAVSLPDSGLGGVALTEVGVDGPWVKDCDAIKGEGPTRWLTRFDTSNWGLIVAYDGGLRVGGAVIAFDTPGLNLLDGTDSAVLWDLRVRPGARSAGVGTALFRASEEWARNRGCRRLDVETQNVNVPACRFYARMGSTLRSIDRFAYPDLPNETRLVWVKQLQP